MKTFHETFKDRIDASDGTVVIDAYKYRSIQADSLRHAADAAFSEGLNDFGYKLRDEASRLDTEL